VILFLIGILIGLVIAAPMGPVGVLCARKTLEYGIAGTLAVGIGTALADAIYAGLTVFGLATISEFVLKHAVYIKLIGGTLLFILAIKEYYSKTPIKDTIKITPKGCLAISATTFLITLLNPIGIISFIAIFAMLGDQLLHNQHAIYVVIGVFVGSLSWFIILGRIIHYTRHLVPDYIILSIRKISALFFAIFGAWAFLSLL